MRDKHYPVRQFRISEENYQKLLKLKTDTWNKLFTDLLYGESIQSTTIQTNKEEEISNLSLARSSSRNNKGVKIRKERPVVSMEALQTKRRGNSKLFTGRNKPRRNKR